MGVFSEGLCPVLWYEREVGYLGFMDTSGKRVVDYRFYDVSAFKNGIAEVETREGVGYIDKTGRYIWEPK